jgi:hypothetical protein
MVLEQQEAAKAGRPPRSEATMRELFHTNPRYQVR